LKVRERKARGARGQRGEKEKRETEMNEITRERKKTEKTKTTHSLFPTSNQKIKIKIPTKKTGDTREAVELAAKKVAPMLDPENDWFHDTKDKQLRELAIINGTLKEGEGDACFLCGGSGHRQFECPSRGVAGSGAAGDAFKLPTAIQASVEAQYARDVARMQGGGGGGGAGGGGNDDEYKNFLEELGGGGGSGGGGGGEAGLPPRPNFGVPPSSRLNSSRRNMLRDPYGSVPGSGGGGGGPPSAADDAPNECKLFLGNLAPSVDDETLRRALEAALRGPDPGADSVVVEVRVVPDDGRSLGDLPAGAPAPRNRGFAFAVMASPEAAADACRRAHGALVEGRPLRVQPRGGRRDEDEDGRKLFITVRVRFFFFSPLQKPSSSFLGLFFSKKKKKKLTPSSVSPIRRNTNERNRASTSPRRSPRSKPSARSTPPPGSAAAAAATPSSPSAS
jgi:hypothetical protein